MRFSSLAITCLLLFSNAVSVAQETAPDFSGIDMLTGESIELNQFLGRVVFLDFWASWCPPCLVSLPAYQQLYEANQSQAWMIIAVNVDADTQDGLTFLEDTPISYPTLADAAGEIGIPYGIRSLPVSFLIDQNGTIVKRYRGFQPGDEQEVWSDIQDLLNSH
jgi:thiol-disulfide isomerase/thioredoxin